jgi:hypothetical protein
MSDSVKQHCRPLNESLLFFDGKSEVRTTNFVADIFLKNESEKEDQPKIKHL